MDWLPSENRFIHGEHTKAKIKIGLYLTNQQDLSTGMVTALDDQIAMVHHIDGGIRGILL